MQDDKDNNIGVSGSKLIPTDGDDQLPSVAECLEKLLGFKLPALPQTVKNIDKVCVSLLGLPITKFEAIARNIKEDQERHNRIENAIEEIKEQKLLAATDPMIEEALKALTIDELKKRQGRERVMEIAFGELGGEKETEDAVKDIDADWVQFFKARIDELATDDARILYGKILAGEIKQPGSFSRKSINILAEMNAEVGQLFETLCNVSSTPNSQSIRVLSLGLGNAAMNSLSVFGLDFDNLNKLNEAGLIIAGYNSSTNMVSEAFGEEFEMGGRKFILDVTAEKKQELADPEKRMEQITRCHGVGLTKSGIELRKIVSLKLNEQYLAKITEEFKKLGFDLKEVK